MGPSSIYITCYGIGDEQMRSYGNRPAKCIICSREYNLDEHQYGVIGCTKSRKKICLLVKAQYANCGDGHIAKCLRFISLQKKSVKGNKERKVRNENEKEKAKVVSKDEDEVRADILNLYLDMKIDNGREESAQE